MSRLVNICLLCGMLVCNVNGQTTESYYINWLNEHFFYGEREVVLYGGRADIVNDEYAIEVEWAKNWKHSIGQALWYGLQTNKKAGIVLIMQNKDQRKYGIMMQSTLDHAGIGDKVKVWFYPEDFGLGFGTPQIQSTDVRYSYNTNSGVRHNSNCAHFSCQNCVPCDVNRGKACGRCGG